MRISTFIFHRAVRDVIRAGSGPSAGTSPFRLARVTSRWRIRRTTAASAATRRPEGNGRRPRRSGSSVESPCAAPRVGATGSTGVPRGRPPRHPGPDPSPLRSGGGPSTPGAWPDPLVTAPGSAGSTNSTPCRSAPPRPSPTRGIVRAVARPDRRLGVDLATLAEVGRRDRPVRFRTGRLVARSSAHWRPRRRPPLSTDRPLGPRGPAQDIDDLELGSLQRSIVRVPGIETDQGCEAAGDQRPARATSAAASSMSYRC